MAELRIVRAESTDHVYAACELVNRAYDLAYQGIFTPLVPDDIPLCSLWVAMLDQAVVGTFTLDRFPGYSVMRHFARHPNPGFRGLGATMLAHARAVARQPLRVQVYARARELVTFYIGRGFVNYVGMHADAGGNTFLILQDGGEP